MQPVSRPRAILFDWDNTLIDSWRAIHAASNVTLEAMGHKAWTLEETKLRVRKSMREAFPELFGDRWTEARDIFYGYFRKHHLDDLEAISGIEQMLRAVGEADIYMGVVSNKDGTLLRAEVDHLGWENYFGAVVGANDAIRDKPAPDPIYLSLAPSGYSADRLTWYAGDTEMDMIFAARAGVVPVLLRAKPPAQGEFGDCPPDLIFENGQNLCAFLDATGN
jgi:phosphoglycolate phosphatase